MFAEQQVADRAADEAGMALLGVERLQQPLDARPVKPFLGIELHASRRVRLTSIAAVAPQIWRPSQSI